MDEACLGRVCHVRERERDYSRVLYGRNLWGRVCHIWLAHYPHDHQYFVLEREWLVELLWTKLVRASLSCPWARARLWSSFMSNSLTGLTTINISCMGESDYCRVYYGLNLCGVSLSCLTRPPPDDHQHFVLGWKSDYGRVYERRLSGVSLSCLTCPLPLRPSREFIMDKDCQGRVCYV